MNTEKLYAVTKSRLHNGVDLIEIDRVCEAIRRYGEHFLTRVYTSTELAQCRGRCDSLAARFAAKEAAAKALGTGVWRDGIGWTDIETVRDERSGAPRIVLHNAAARHAETLGLTEWSLSLSHSRQLAIAMVVAMGRGIPCTSPESP